jgi:hydrogenase maturation protein HypF
VCDTHPQFRSTRATLQREDWRVDSVLQVQHHHAHMAACIAENRLQGTVVGVVFDGAGYGEDGTIWGCEFLVGDCAEARRVAHLRPIALLGGDRAVHEPIRTGFALALDAFDDRDAAVSAFPVLRELDEQRLQVFETMMRRRVNSPPASSAGRLFDGVAALVGLAPKAEYEAHGPIELEGLLGRDLELSPSSSRYRFASETRDGVVAIDQRPVIRTVAADLAAGADAVTISRRFHSGVVDMVVERCLDAAAGERRAVVLSGGVFLNEFLLVNCLVELRRAGLDAHCHRHVPPNDGGIALGQVAVASARLSTA